MSDKVFELDTDLNLGDCFLWQYDQAAKIKSLLQKKQSFCQKEITEFWNNWLTNVFNIDTANEFGLSIWGTFLDVQRPSYELNGEIVQFDDDQYRTLIKGRLMLMNSNGSIPSINAYLNYLFPGKAVFAVDYYDMSINLVFYYQPTEKEMAIIQSEGFLPKPAGVNIKYVIVPPDEVFGFDGQEMQTFDNGTFLA